MRGILKWAIAPIGWFGIALAFVGFLLYISVTDGPADAWRELKLFVQSIISDLKSL